MEGVVSFSFPLRQFRENKDGLVVNTAGLVRLFGDWIVEWEACVLNTSRC